MKFILSLTLCVLLASSASAQGLSRVSMDKGQRFMVAFAPYLQIQTEKPLPKPLEIIITTEFEANVRIRSLDTSAGAAIIDKTFFVVPKNGGGGVASLSVPLTMVVSTSKRKARVAFEVTSDVPVTVTTRRSWSGGGEEAHILPQDHLGTEYRVFSMPSDVIGVATRTWFPGFLAVVGTVDGTRVLVTSKLKLIDPLTGSPLPADTPYTLTLDAGEVAMFDHVIDTLKVLTPEQDLTGTLVTANHPVGVLSGHLKGSVLTRYAVLPPSGPFASDAHFVRNGLAEMLPPVTMADTSFVMTPFAYTSTRRGYKHHDSADCMILGDLVRFVATQNNTFVYKQQSGDPNRKLLGVIEAGQMLTDSSLFESASYWSSKPILAAQYGRTYALILLTGVDKNPSQQTQGFPIVESGMPSMAMVVPESRWVTSAVWAAPPGMDNFCSIVYRTGNEAKIEWNGRPLTEVGVRTEIVNTPYSQLTSHVATEVNLVRATADGVRFNVLPQCSLDGLQQGRAMAHPTGFDNPAPGLDTIIIADEMLAVDASNCGIREATATINGVNGITSLFATERLNYRLILDSFEPGAKSATYRVEPINASVAGNITVRIVAASGTIAERTYIYQPQPASITSTSLPTTLGIGVPECFDVTITNPGTEVLAITSLSFLKGGMIDVNAQLPLSLDPGSTQVVSCCFAPTTIGTVNDTLIASLTCYDFSFGSMTYNVVAPIIAVDDVMFGRVEPSAAPITKATQILNRTGGVKMIVSQIRWAEGTNDSHFQFDTTGIGLPITLLPNQSVSLPVTYTPNGDEGTHKASIRIVNTSTGSDSVFFCSAESKTTSSVNEAADVIGLRPIPVVIGGQLTAHVAPMSTAQVIDIRGRVIEDVVVAEDGLLQIKITSERYVRGTYVLVVSSVGGARSYRWVVE